MNKSKGLMVTGAATLLLCAGAVQAADGTPKGNAYEATGLGSGLVIGALAAGPVGAVIGGAAGALLGDRMHRDRGTITLLEGERAALDAELAEERSRSERLDAAVADMRREIGQRDRALTQAAGVVDRLGEALEVSVLFRTGDASLDEADMRRLERLGVALADLPGLEVWVEGHADPRGDEGFNEALSASRAETVRAVLMNAGLGASQVTAVAHGASRSQADDGDLDAYALERRVNIRMIVGGEHGRVAGQR